MFNHTIRSLAAALKVVTAVAAYGPIVVIQPKGTKQPLWLGHPGVGEILVFVKLAIYFTDQPFYVFRARTRFYQYRGCCHRLLFGDETETASWTISASRVQLRVNVSV
jgi:hypothetical protein